MTRGDAIHVVSARVALRAPCRRIRERDVSAEPRVGPAAMKCAVTSVGVVVVVDSSSGAVAEDFGDEGSLVVEDQRFAIVPEWVITAEVSDAAFRAYSMLLRFGGTSGYRMPSRALLGSS